MTDLINIVPDSLDFISREDECGVSHHTRGGQPATLELFPWLLYVGMVLTINILYHALGFPKLIFDLVDL